MKNKINDIKSQTLPPKYAAKYLGISLWQLRRLTWNQDIQYIQYPGSRNLYYAVKDLDKLLERNKRYAD
jgi:hypothetical protein